MNYKTVLYASLLISLLGNLKVGVVSAQGVSVEYSGQFAAPMRSFLVDQPTLRHALSLMHSRPSPCGPVLVGLQLHVERQRSTNAPYQASDGTWGYADLLVRQLIAGPFIGVETSLFQTYFLRPTVGISYALQQHHSYRVDDDGSTLEQEISPALEDRFYVPISLRVGKHLRTSWGHATFSLDATYLAGVHSFLTGGLGQNQLGLGLSAGYRIPVRGGYRR